MDEAPHRHHTSAAALALVAIMAAALVLRVHGLQAESPWNDEIFSLQCLGEPSLSSYLTRYADLDPTMSPVYFTLQYGWSRVFGSSVAIVRAMSVLFGLASIGVIFLLGQALFTTRAGLAAAFYTSLSLLHIYYSQEIRGYPLVLLLTALSMYFYVRAIEANRPAHWIALAATNGLIAGTHVIAAFLLIPQGVHLLLFRRKRPRYFLAWALGQAIALLPVALLMAMRYGAARDMLFLIHQTSWYDFAHTFLIFAGGRWSNMNPAPHLPGNISLDAILALYAVGLAAVALYGALGDRPPETHASRGGPSPEHVFLLIFWFIIPPLALFTLSHTWHRCFQYRYVLYSSLALYLMAGGGIGTLTSSKRAWAAFSVLAILLGYQALALRGGPLRPDFASAARHKESHMAPGDRVVAFKGFTSLAIRFHADIPDVAIDATESFGDAIALTEKVCQGGGTAWVLMFQWTHPEWFQGRFDQVGLTAKTLRFGRWPHLIVYRVTQNRPSQSRERGPSDQAFMGRASHSARQRI
jgi:4-amino-4-deoxy-L-arabinose transferase-like glycosyltransferase